MSFPQADWTDPFAAMRLRRQQALMSVSPDSPSMEGAFDPESDSVYSSFWRKPLPYGAQTPQLGSSGSSGQGVSGQPQADLSTKGPDAAAGKLLAQTKAPPPSGPIAQPDEGPSAPPASPNASATSPAPPPRGAPPTPTPKGPPPGETAPVAQNKTDLSGAISQAQERLAASPAPTAHSNWAQRLGMAVLSMTRLAPYAQQLIHPKFTEQMGAHEAAQKELDDLVKTQEAAQRGAYYQQQADEGKGRYLRVGTGVFDQQAGKWVTMPMDKSNLVPIDPGLARERGLAPLDDGKFWVPASVAAQIAKPTRSPADTQEISPEEGRRLGIMPDENGKYILSKEGIGPYVSGKEKPPAAPTAEGEKIAYQNAIAKLSAAGELPANAASDANALLKALRSSKVLTPAERDHAVSFLTANPTPSSSGTAATIRVEGMQQSRIGTYVDTSTGQLVSMNADEFNGANRANPGRYVASTAAAPAMKGHATFNDIQYNIDNARNSIQALSTLDAGARAELANALSDGSGSRMEQFLTGSVMSTMSPAQKQAVISLRNLYENALALRGVVGMGQGSDQLRKAILDTLPNAKSPDIPYMVEQIRQFEGIVQRLHEGVPRLGSGGHNPAPVVPPTGKPTREQIQRVLSGQ